MKAELATRKDIPEILGLMAHCMPHLVRTEPELLWQYYDAPKGEPKFWIIRDDGKITGLYSSYAQNIRVNGKVLRARRTQDGMTHSSCAGRGYHGFLMNECRADGVANGEIVYGFPNDKAIGAYQRYKDFMVFKRIWMRNQTLGATGESKIKISPVAAGEFNDADTKVWDSTRFPIAIHREHTYLNWRYSRPDQIYHRFRIGNGEGVLVLKLFSNETDSFVHVCELFVHPGIEDKIPDVLEFAKSFGKKNGAKTLTSWLQTGDLYEKAYEKAGLELKETTRYMFLSAPDGIKDTVYRDGLWHLTQADSDVY